MTIAKDKITEFFCMTDDFCHIYDRFIKINGLAPKRDKSKRKYHRDGILSDAEVITMMIQFHLCGYKCLKHFYLNEVCENMTDLFPHTVSYNRFVELERKVAIPFILFVKKCCMGACTGISFVDSTALRVCRNQRIHLHIVYGFKLHLICNEKGELLNFMVTPGNVDDREPLRNKSFIEQIFGKLVGDKGYICKDLFSKLFVDGIQLITKLKDNMKGQIMTISDKILLRKRALIETISDELKNMAQIEHSRHRSIAGFTANLMAGLAAYSFFPKKPMIDVERVSPYENSVVQLEINWL